MPFMVAHVQYSSKHATWWVINQLKSPKASFKFNKNPGWFGREKESMDFKQEKFMTHF